VSQSPCIILHAKLDARSCRDWRTLGERICARRRPMDIIEKTIDSKTSFQAVTPMARTWMMQLAPGRYDNNSETMSFASPDEDDYAQRFRDRAGAAGFQIEIRT
jgi:hypothetical protein